MRPKQLPPLPRFVYACSMNFLRLSLVDKPVSVVSWVWPTFGSAGEFEGPRIRKAETL